MLKIRLRREGSINRPCYKIVVCDSKVAAKTGVYIDSLGQYIPKRKPPLILIDTIKLELWVRRGAKLSDTVQFLVKRAGSPDAARQEKPAEEKADSAGASA